MLIRNRQVHLKKLSIEAVDRYIASPPSPLMTDSLLSDHGENAAEKAKAVFRTVHPVGAKRLSDHSTPLSIGRNKPVPSPQGVRVYDSTSSATHCSEFLPPKPQGRSFANLHLFSLLDTFPGHVL
jgi:hypothetical protein